MVCRENKARSTYMGITKHYLRQAGLGDFDDHELQSMIHDKRHDFEGAGTPSVEEQVCFLKGMRQQILNDPTLSDAQKFRPDRGRASQPGFITRLDQELERLRTGRHTDPVTGETRPLEQKQLNMGKDAAAMARLLQPAMRAQYAKQAYAETYARHMGIEVEDARQRYRELVKRSKAERLNTEISLNKRDAEGNRVQDWKDSLAVSGLSTQQQDDMGQSNVQREALRLMEAERLHKVNSYPKRSAMRPEHQTKILHSDDPIVKVQCVGGCGQFGHTADDCPHRAEVDAAADATAAADAATAKAEALKEQARVATYVKMVDRGDTVGDVGPDGERYVTGPDGPQKVTEEQIGRWRQEAEGFSQRAANRAVKAARAAQEEADAANAALEEARGPIPPVSSWVKTVAYNPDNGTMVITTAPYRLKKTGEERPAKSYVRRVSPETYAKMMASDSWGSAISNTVFGRAAVGGSEPYRAANAAEERELLVERQCPSCGQFASFTQDHQCPVDGSLTTQEEHARGVEMRKQRHYAEVAGLPATMGDRLKRFEVTSQVRGRLADNGVTTFPAPAAVDQIAGKGAVAIGYFNASYLGQAVNGRVFVWTDQNTGQRLYRITDTKCSCGKLGCRHIDLAASTLSRPYGAQRQYGQIGAPSLNKNVPVAGNTVVNDPDASTYEQIRTEREHKATRIAKYFTPEAKGRQFYTMPPTRNGVPVDTRTLPSEWTDGSTSVDVNDTTAVTETVRRRLNHVTGRDEKASNWKVSADSAGGVWIRSAEGSKPEMYGKMYTAHQNELKKAFGLSSRCGGRGIYIPAHASWRHEMLDRLAGREPHIQGARFAGQPA